MLLAASACSLQAGETSPSPREFVQAFYNWYTPLARGNNAGPAWNLALKNKSAAFTPELLRALKEDFAAQAKVADDIVGLDFDPFLSSQDPGNRYEVGRITAKGDSYLVEIQGVRPGRKNAKPDVVAELSYRGGRWLFVNFHYDEGQDLLTVLRILKEDREKSPK